MYKEQGGASEREVAAAHIEVMQVALAAMREAERKDWADVLSRSIQARLVRLKQLKGPQAKIALEREPKLEQTVKALFAAADQWREYRNQKNAGAVRALANKFGAFREGAKKERPRKSDGLQRLKQLESEVAELEAALERRLRELKELDQKRDR